MASFAPPLAVEAGPSSAAEAGPSQVPRAADGQIEPSSAPRRSSAKGKGKARASQKSSPATPGDGPSALKSDEEEDKPCDRCMLKHKHCTRSRVEGEPCKRCAWSGAECTYNVERQRRRRVPKGSKASRPIFGSSATASSSASKTSRRSSAPRLTTASESSFSLSDASDDGTSTSSFQSTSSGTGTGSGRGSGSEPPPSRLPYAQPVREEIQPDIADWVAYHATISFEPSDEGGALLKLRLPEYMTAIALSATDELEQATQLTSHPAVADTPPIFRRCPQKPGAVRALQAGQPAFLFEDPPDAPGYHTPAELRKRPLRLGASVWRAHPDGLYVLLLDADGVLQAVPPDSCLLDSRALFQSLWSTPGPGGAPLAPPWAELGRGDEPCTLWPADHAQHEAAYTPLMQRAQRMLANELSARFIELDTSLRAQYFIIFQLTMSSWLRALVAADPASATPSGWTSTQARHRQALLLALQAAYPQYAGPIAVTIGGLGDGGWSPGSAAASGLLQASVSAWEYGFACQKLAWLLLQPRCGGRFAEDELTLDALVAVSLLVDSMRMHPAYLEMYKANARLVLAPAAQAAVAKQISGDAEATETYRRLLAFYVRQTDTIRLWRQQTLPFSFVPQYAALGDMRLFPGEYFYDNAPDGAQCMAMNRHGLRAQQYLTRLSMLNDQLVGSWLLSPDEGAPRLSPIKVAEARRLCDAFRVWYAEALDYKRAEQDAPPFDKEAAERQHGRWGFLWDPHFTCALRDGTLHDCAAVSFELLRAMVRARLTAARLASGAHDGSALLCDELEAVAQRCDALFATVPRATQQMPLPRPSA